MGDWAITLQGVGSHHNGSADDVEALVQKFILGLRKHGHSVTVGTVHAGGGVIRLDLDPRHKSVAESHDHAHGDDRDHPVARAIDVC